MDEITLKDKNLFKVRQPGSEIDFSAKKVVSKARLNYKNSPDVSIEKLSLKSEQKKEQKEYEAVKVDLPESIKEFDKKVKVYTKNPYDYNEISLKKEKVPVPLNKTASELIVDPVYNTIGKFLGVDTAHDWSKYYDKVYTIVEWAKLKNGDNVKEIMKWLDNKAKTLPSVGSKTLDNLYIFARMKLNE